MTDTPIPSCAKEEDLDTVRVNPLESGCSSVCSSSSLVGQVLEGHYEILESLGVGGMGEVYKAHHLLMDRVVAIKVLLPHLAQEENCIRRFQQEAIATARLDHENICRILEFKSPSNSSPYLVMDFVNGTRLSDVISKEQMPLDRVAIIACQIASALKHAHGSGILHRDLKPTNILISTIEGNDVVKIVDFGIARILSNAPDGKLTSTGVIVGSPVYMSPEQCRARETDHRSDIYSFGCVLYEMITGRPPLRGATALETIQMHANRAPENPKNKRIDCPAQLAMIVMKCLEKQPSDRFSSTKDLHAELVCFRNQTFQHADEPELLRPKQPQIAEKQGSPNEQSFKVTSLSVLAIATMLLFVSVLASQNIGTNSTKDISTRQGKTRSTTDDAKATQSVEQQYAQDRHVTFVHLADSYKAHAQWEKLAKLDEQMLSKAQSIEGRIYFSRSLALALCKSKVNQTKRGVDLAKNAVNLANEEYVRSVQSRNLETIESNAETLVSCYLILSYAYAHNKDFGAAAHALKQAHKIADINLKKSQKIQKRLAEYDAAMARLLKEPSNKQATLHHFW